MLLAIGPDGQPINFFFDTTTLDFNVSNSQIVGGKHLLNYGGNVRYNTFELSIAPRGDNRNEFGAYLQDEWFINDKFRWVLGARVDRFSILDKAIVSPRTTFLIKPDPDHTIRVSVNRAFRAPSFVNNFLQTAVLNQINLGAIDPRLSGVQYIFPLLALGNEGLDEESMTAYEVGYTGTFARRYTAGISFYYNDTRDSILFTTVDTYSSQNPPPGWPLPPFILDLLIQAGAGLPSELSYRNFEKLIDKGVELSLNARINREWSVYGNYSWQAEPEPIGFDLSEVNLPPKNRFNVGVNFNADRYFGSLSLAYQDSAFWQDVLDVRFDGPTESFALINGTFGVRFADQRLSAAVRFTNLGNDDVQQHVFGDIIKRQIVGEVTVHIR